MLHLRQYNISGKYVHEKLHGNNGNADNVWIESVIIKDHSETGVRTEKFLLKKNELNITMQTSYKQK